MFKKIVLGILFSVVLSFADSINVDELLVQAKSEDKHIMFFFHIPGCPYCQRMIDENFNDSQVKELIEKNFILVDIYTADSSSVTFKGFEGKHKSFARHLGCRAFPSTYFMNGSGEVIYRSIGYRNIGEYVTELNYIGSRSYKDTDLESFRENYEFEKDD